MSDLAIELRRSIERLPANDPRRAKALEQFAPKPSAPAPVAVSGTTTADGTVTALAVTMCLKTVSEANSRDMGVKMGRVKRQRATVRDTLRSMGRVLPMFPVVVTLTRISRKTLDDDNLQSAFKAVRDGVADAMNRDDGDVAAYEWRYAQEVGASGYAVRILIESRKAATP